MTQQLLDTWQAWLYMIIGASLAGTVLELLIPGEKQSLMSRLRAIPCWILFIFPPIPKNPRCAMPWIGPMPSSPSSRSDYLSKRTLDLAPRRSVQRSRHLVPVAPRVLRQRRRTAEVGLQRGIEGDALSAELYQVMCFPEGSIVRG